MQQLRGFDGAMLWYEVNKLICPSKECNHLLSPQLKVTQGSKFVNIKINEFYGLQMKRDRFDKHC